MKKETKKKLDNIHYDYTKINGYHVLFYVVISARDPGKTTMKIIDCYNQHVKTGAGFVFITRQVNDITEGYLNSFQEVINDFIDPDVVLVYGKGGLSQGVVDIRVKGEEEIFIRVQGLSKKINSQKRFRMSNIRDIVFDEFICNPAFDEKYLTGEYEKLREVIKTYQKDNPKLRVYLLGNPYSLFNPYFMAWNVNTNKLKIGHMYSDGVLYVIDFYRMKPELRAKLLLDNPDYKIDEDYAHYALDGQAINDQNIRLYDHVPERYSLMYVFRFGKKLIGVFRANDIRENVAFYLYAKYVDEASWKRTVMCFDFNDIINGAVLMARSDAWRYEQFKQAFRHGDIAFSSIEVYYLLQEVYEQI